MHRALASILIFHFYFRVLLRLNQIPCKYPEVSMLRAIEFDLPVRRPNNRLVGDYISSPPP